MGSIGRTNRIGALLGAALATIALGAAGAGGEALSLRPRPAAQFRLQRRLRPLLREAEGAERRQDAGRPVPGRAARPGAAAAAAGEVRRPRFRDRLVGEHRDDLAAGGRDVAAFPLPLARARHQGARRPAGVRGDPRHDRPDHPGHPRDRPGHPGAAQPLRQEGDPQRRGPEGPQGARAGDRDRGHHVPGLRRADRAHALRQRLHVAADRRGRLRRELGQRLPHQQALRGRAGALDLRARGEQRDPLGQRQAVAEPQRRPEEMGARRRPRREHPGARRRPSSSRTRRSPRSRRSASRWSPTRQVRVPEDRRSVPRQAREGARARTPTRSRA